MLVRECHLPVCLSFNDNRAFFVPGSDQKQAPASDPLNVPVSMSDLVSVPDLAAAPVSAPDLARAVPVSAPDLAAVPVKPDGPFLKSGSYGCVYAAPGFFCPGQPELNQRFYDKGTYLSKLLVRGPLTEGTRWDQEAYIGQLIHDRVDADQKFFLYLIPGSACTTLQPQQYVDSCPLRASSAPVAYSLLQGGRPYRGVVEEWIRAGQAEQPDLLGKLLRDFIHLFEGLASLHRGGIVHMDISASNILMQEEAGNPRIIDFGLALEMEDWATDGKKFRTEAKFRNRYYSRQPLEMAVVASIADQKVSSRDLYYWMLTIWMQDRSKRFQWIPFYPDVVAARPQWNEWNRAKISRPASTPPARTVAPHRLVVPPEIPLYFTDSPLLSYMDSVRDSIRLGTLDWRALLTSVDVYMLGIVLLNIWMSSLPASYREDPLYRPIRSVLALCVHPVYKQRLTAEQALSRLRALTIQER